MFDDCATQRMLDIVNLAEHLVANLELTQHLLDSFCQRPAKT